MKGLISMKNGIFFLLAVVSLVACNSGQAGQAPRAYVVEIKDMQFQPAILTLSKGDTVTWVNEDIVAHNVTQKDAAWASPTLPPEATWQKVINSSDPYYCSIHINMKGELVVK
ncbi:MAG: cupredoxin domain-containing protein [Bacteroidetes bacterium]|nr:cupredoxin domain-containing protein [Bacteroidota bacterium]